MIWSDKKSAKKHFNLSTPRGSATDWFENIMRMLSRGKPFANSLQHNFLTDETNFDREWKYSTVYEAMGDEIRNFLHRTKKIVDKRYADDMQGITEGERVAERLSQGRQK